MIASPISVVDSSYTATTNPWTESWPEVVDWEAPRPQTLEYALGYARLGHFVMAGRPFYNAPYARLYGRGWHHAEDGPGTRDELRIKQLFAETYGGISHSNIGLQLGRGRLVCFDVDQHPGRANGAESEKTRLIRSLGLPEETTRAGMHYFARWPQELDLPHSRGWSDGVELKAFGNFLAVWPSARPPHGVSPAERDFFPISYSRSASWPCPLGEVPTLSVEQCREVLNWPIQRQKSDGSCVTETPEGASRVELDKFLESGFGWRSGSRTHDMYALACSLTNRYWREPDGGMRSMFQTLIRVYDATENTDGFPWSKVHDQARGAWEWTRSQIENERAKLEQRRRTEGVR